MCKCIWLSYFNRAPDTNVPFEFVKRTMYRAMTAVLPKNAADVGSMHMINHHSWLSTARLNPASNRNFGTMMISMVLA